MIVLPLNFSNQPWRVLNEPKMEEGGVQDLLSFYFVADTMRSTLFHFILKVLLMVLFTVWKTSWRFTLKVSRYTHTHTFECAHTLTVLGLRWPYRGSLWWPPLRKGKREEPAHPSESYLSSAQSSSHSEPVSSTFSFNSLKTVWVLLHTCSLPLWKSLLQRQVGGKPNLRNQVLGSLPRSPKPAWIWNALCVALRHLLEARRAPSHAWVSAQAAKGDVKPFIRQQQETQAISLLY